MKETFLCSRRSHLWMHQAMAYWYQVEVIRKSGIKTQEELVRFILNKAHEHLDGMAKNVGRKNGDIIPPEFTEENRRSNETDPR